MKKRLLMLLLVPVLLLGIYVFRVPLGLMTCTVTFSINGKPLSEATTVTTKSNRVIELSKDFKVDIINLYYRDKHDKEIDGYLYDFYVDGEKIDLDSYKVKKDINIDMVPLDKVYFEYQEEGSTGYICYALNDVSEIDSIDFPKSKDGRAFCGFDKREEINFGLYNDHFTEDFLVLGDLYTPKYQTKVTFVHNGEVLEERLVTKGDTIEAPDFTLKGYAFFGWGIVDTLNDYPFEKQQGDIRFLSVPEWDNTVSVVFDRVDFFDFENTPIDFDITIEAITIECTGISLIQKGQTSAGTWQDPLTKLNVWPGISMNFPGRSYLQLQPSGYNLTIGERNYIKFYSGDPNIADYDPENKCRHDDKTGIMTAKNVGTTELTIDFGGYKKTITLNVKPESSFDHGPAYGWVE